MPREVFVAGQILTAAELNTVSDQSVMVFADSTARTAAIPTPSEGMITYLSDTNAVEKYDGAAFVNVDTGGLIAVQSVLKTDTFSASVAGGASVDVTDLAITYTLTDSSNKLLIMANFGQAANSVGVPLIGLGIKEDSTFIAQGDASSSRLRISAGGRTSGATDGGTGTPISLQFLHTPGAGSKTYQVTAHNGRTDTRTLYVNRSHSDADSAEGMRTVSTLTIMEVAV